MTNSMHNGLSLSISLSSCPPPFYIPIILPIIIACYPALLFCLLQTPQRPILEVALNSPAAIRAHRCVAIVSLATGVCLSVTQIRLWCSNVFWWQPIQAVKYEKYKNFTPMLYPWDATKYLHFFRGVYCSSQFYCISLESLCCFLRSSHLVT